MEAPSAPIHGVDCVPQHGCALNRVVSTDDLTRPYLTYLDKERHPQCARLEPDQY